jgi:outer membrane protein OmpU
MNKLKKIGLTAIAASLASVSAHAVDLSVSGGASLSYTSNGNGGASTNNPWAMSDTANFSASGELDNGWTVDFSLGLDGSKGAAASPFEDRTLSIGMGDLGTLTLNGEDGSSVTGAMDDKMPTAYEETWFQADGPGNGAATNNMWNYSNSSIDGVTLMASFTPASATELESSTEIGITYTGIDGLTIGLASGTDGGAGLTSEVENQTMYVTYAYDAFTFGIQDNESDSEVADADEEYRAYAVSYAVNDDLSVSIGMSDLDYEGSSTEIDTTQEATAISASYTMGSMSFGATRSDVDNSGGDENHDGAGYEINLAFAF